MFDLVLTLLTLVAAGLALRWAIKVEPHWASRDAQRFTARAQLMAHGDLPDSRWRDVRVAVTADRALQLQPRGLGASHLNGRWYVTHATVDPTGRHALYVAARGDGAASGHQRLVVRIPRSSRAVATLDELARQGPSPSTG